MTVFHVIAVAAQAMRKDRTAVELEASTQAAGTVLRIRLLRQHKDPQQQARSVNSDVQHADFDTQATQKELRLWDINK